MKIEYYVKYCLCFNGVVFIFLSVLLPYWENANYFRLVSNYLLKEDNYGKEMDGNYSTKE